MVIMATIMLVIPLMIVTGSAKAVSVGCAEHLGIGAGQPFAMLLPLPWQSLRGRLPPPSPSHAAPFPSSPAAWGFSII
jgi:hypothetical protein